MTKGPPPFALGLSVRPEALEWERTNAHGTRISDDDRMLILTDLDVEFARRELQSVEDTLDPEYIAIIIDEGCRTADRIRGR